MNEMSAMPSKIAEWLSEREEFKDMKFLTEFPPIRKAVPLRKITVAVGIGGIDIEDAFESTESTVLETEEYCRKAKINLRFYIHVPYSMGGKACHETFADIIDCLTFDSGLNITTSGCEKISEDRDTDAFVLTAFAIVSSTLCPAESSSLVFPSFLDKTLLCGSHIRNEKIHLSEKQQEFLNSPYVGGIYYGTGENANTVELDFEPSAVIVTAGGMAPFKIEGDYTLLYTATGVKEGASLGLELTSSGFTVTNGKNYISNNAYPMLNEKGTFFSYIAFKSISDEK